MTNYTTNGHLSYIFAATAVVSNIQVTSFCLHYKQHCILAFVYLWYIYSSKYWSVKQITKILAIFLLLMDFIFNQPTVVGGGGGNDRFVNRTDLAKEFKDGNRNNRKNNWSLHDCSVQNIINKIFCFD